MRKVQIRTERLLAHHLLQLERQPSQLTHLGMPSEIGPEEAEALADEREAFAVFAPCGTAGERLIACVGINELFPGTHGVAWALLAPGLGRAHLALTRFVRQRLDASRLARIETFAVCADAEAILARFPWLGGGRDAGFLLSEVLRQPTPECRWAELLGFRAAHVLRKYGGKAETIMLFERLR